jgi:chemotaxis protein MotB
MALSRRGNQRVSTAIWPGFVDAMTALLLVLFFVLSIFMIVQSVLRERITTQDTELDALAAQVASLADALGLARGQVVRLEGALDAAETRAAEQDTLIAGLTAQLSERGAALEAAEARITGFEAQVAALLLDRDAARAEIAELETREAALLSEQEALEAALASLRDERDAEAEAARLAAARAEAVEAALAAARATADAREATLAELLARLEAAETEGAALAEALTEREADLDAAEAARLAELAAAEALRTRLADVEATLTEAEAARLAEIAAAEALRARLRDADAELTAMTLALEAERRRAEETLTLLAAADAARDRAEAEAERRLSEAERRAALLAAAEAQLAEADAQSLEDQRRLALLNRQTSELSAQLAQLQALLDDAVARDVEREVEIQALGAQLNVALARVAAEERRRAELEAAERRRLEEEAQRLEAYASEFFGRLLEVLAGREGVQVVGDRFVFSSEVLFPPASADLSPEGRSQIAGVVGLLSEVAQDIPDGIDWILRVDGHTDDRPLTGGGQFADNWELSQGRALSVVRYMIEELGFPPQRLAATGFGEYRPVATNLTEAGRAQNRRIELKLTER